eukprot:SAG11_NODE_1008_length_6205_cov_3.939240_2_plen_53_part_00
MFFANFGTGPPVQKKILKAQLRFKLLKADVPHMGSAAESRDREAAAGWERAC